mmetsp:Transcript_19106/g.31676  ORF Transcript_19106/g.31676 Transcript_19106/m.31676 type:complete len:100 (-) Transcript_19106:117-416(-)
MPASSYVVARKPILGHANSTGTDGNTGSPPSRDSPTFPIPGLNVVKLWSEDEKEGAHRCHENDADADKEVGGCVVSGDIPGDDHERDAYQSDLKDRKNR